MLGLCARACGTLYKALGPTFIVLFGTVIGAAITVPVGRYCGHGCSAAAQLSTAGQWGVRLLVPVNRGRLSLFQPSGSAATLPLNFGAVLCPECSLQSSLGPSGRQRSCRCVTGPAPVYG